MAPLFHRAAIKTETTSRHEILWAIQWWKPHRSTRLRQLLKNRKLRHLWRHNLGSRWKLRKMARENFSIGAFYNITKNQHNPIKTVGRDSFLSPQTPKNTSLLGVTQPQGSHSSYILGDTTRPRHIGPNICPSLIEIGSKTAEKNSAQANKQTATTKIMVTWPWTKNKQHIRHRPKSDRILPCEDDMPPQSVGSICSVWTSSSQ